MSGGGNKIKCAFCGKEIRGEYETIEQGFGEWPGYLYKCGDCKEKNVRDQHKNNRPAP